MRNMNEEKLARVLPLMFRRKKVSRQAKEDLRRRLFGDAELSDDDLSHVAAAGYPMEQERKKQDKI